ncbi:farnesyl transferase alpha [Dermatophagoides pteronyssinus]|uniref:farnesyl transferase alpha n=1 Tax=Dermatophagoides pteronyssinus TaxID=6956 RepID=UPI003F67A5B9
MATFTILNPDQIDADDSSSDEYYGNDFVMYKDREDWADIEPVKQNDGHHAIVSISYLPQYEDTYNYFRAIMAKEEISERALQLTEDCIRFNPTNYTVWHYRRILLERLKKDPIDELNYIHRIILKNPKNYQVWEHQKFMLRKIREKIERNEFDGKLTIEDVCQKFKQFIDKVLHYDDSKNYHAWQQRQWFIRDWKKFDGEIDFTEKMIDHDIRNNSAWNHRFFVIKNTTGFSFDIIKQECEYTMEKNRLAPNNESSWNYLFGLIKQSDTKIESFEWILDECQTMYNEQTDKTLCSPHLVYFMFRFLTLKMESLIENDDDGGDNDKNSETMKSLYEQAVDYCEKLAKSIDTVRKNYWNYQLEQLKKFYAS